MRSLRSTLVLCIGVLVAGACASSGSLSQDPSLYGSATPEQAVGAFLGAADAQDYQAMGRQFGTPEGPAEREMGLAEVEQRMVVLARLLQHDEYQLRRENAPGGEPDRTRLVAEMTGTRNGSVSVPVITATTDRGRWFVEQLELRELTSGPVR